MSTDSPTVPRGYLKTKENVITVRDLFRRFGKVEALRGLSLTIAPGSVTGLIGNNGAGKTTAIHTLLGFLPPNEGTVSVLGLDPCRDEIEIRRRVGFFPERDQPYDWMRIRTLFDMGAAAYASWDRNLCEALCRRFDLDTHRRIKQLSKGMVAKTKLIFAFTHHPDCLLLDEPTAGLDPSSRHDLLTMIRELTANRGVTTLFSSHNLDDVAGIATDLTIIHEGKLLFSADMDTIQNRLAIVEVFEWTQDVPSVLVEQVIKSVQRPQASLWLARDRNSSALTEFRQAHGPARTVIRGCTLMELFLFLTEGSVNVCTRSEDST